MRNVSMQIGRAIGWRAAEIVDFSQSLRPARTKKKKNRSVQTSFQRPTSEPTTTTTHQSDLQKPKEVRTSRKMSTTQTSPITMCHLRTHQLAALLLISLAAALRASESNSNSNFIDSSSHRKSNASYADDLDELAEWAADSQRLARRQSLREPPSSAKFVRTNELDVFLDDMDHNEVRSLATGLPLSGRDLFRPAPLPAPSLPKQAAGSRLVGMRQPLPAEGESASERQIYSECALILQRTYVKNLEDPKHQLVPFGKTEQACISYKHIDKAVEQAKHNLKFRELNLKLRKRQRPGSGPPLPPFEVIHSSLEPPEDLIAAIGELNMATTQIIADQFDLSNDELLNGLPLIDMSKTKFWPLCPLLVRQDIKCELRRFRTLTGHCNNLKHPTWGAAMTPFARYLPPVHPDGIWVPRKSIVSELALEMHPNELEEHGEGISSAPGASFARDFFETDFHDIARRSKSVNSLDKSDTERLLAAGSVQFLQRADEAEFERRLQPDEGGQPAASQPLQRRHEGRKAKPAAQELPSARLVTSIVHRDVDIPAHDFSILFMSWGQLLDHDMTRAAQPPSSIKCCPGNAAGSGSGGGSNLGTIGRQQGHHKLCLPIKVPPNDPLYSKFNVHCLEFRRSLAGVRPNCVLGPRVHQNAITAPIDANFVYGSSRAQAEALRLFKGGRLRDRDWFRQEGLKPLLPAQEVEPDLECIGRPRDLFCFLAGDVRANEQTHLTVLHTLYMREHNRMADKLAELNPHWDDERVYQETRHIMAAGVQNVMLNEYIPLLIGKKMAELYNLTSTSSSAAHANKHYWHGYDPSVTTSVSNSFAAAAFRQGHTFVQGTVERYNKFHEFVASERLRHLFKQPFLLYKPGVLDELVGGMINQPAQSYDPFLSEDISGHLFQAPEAKIGHDLAAINLQRGREQGLPGYNLFREWCGLPRAETFEQLEPYLTNRTAYHYSRLYKHVDDIDLWSGGISERKLPGAAIGPTFACIIARQFSNTRRGDRFWFENPNLPSSFTPEQLAEVRKISLAKILCANSDELPTIQRWALRTAHPVLNPRLACDQLPEVELHYWQEE